MINSGSSPAAPTLGGGNRSGFGAVFILVMVVIVIMGTMGVASYFQSSGTGRTYARLVDTRSALEAGDAALAEAVSLMRASMDSGSSSADCPDNWRQLILDAMEAPANFRTSMTGRRVIPSRARAIFAPPYPALEIGDVQIDVIDFFVPVQTPGVVPDNPPQGLVEMSVTVGGAQKLMRVEKTLRQRRVFFVGVDPSVPVGTTITAAGATITFLPNPLATVIQ